MGVKSKSEIWAVKYMQGKGSFCLEGISSHLWAVGFKTDFTVIKEDKRSGYEFRHGGKSL